MTTTTLSDDSGRRVEIRTAASPVGTRLLLTIYPKRAWAGRIEKASAHLQLELTPAQVRILIAGLSEYLYPEKPADGGDAGVPAV